MDIKLKEKFMRLALDEAKKAFDIGEVPVGAVIVDPEGNVIASAHNLVESYQDATAHAEMLCLQRAMQQLSSWRLLNLTLFCTLEPCSMCLGALLLSRVKKIVWGAPDIRHGACGSFVNLIDQKHATHSLDYEKGVLEQDCSCILRKFFKELRGL